MRIFVYFAICSFIFISCSFKKKLIRKLYLYERSQFVETNKSRNIKALKMWQDNHEFIIKNLKGCNSFILIDWFDSSKRINQYFKRNDYYGTDFKMCGDSGYVVNTMDSIQLVKTSYKQLDLIDKAIMDSITKHELIAVVSSAPIPIRIIQVVEIKGRKIKISGFNLNRRIKFQKKI